jgi:uncharacterized protein YfaS (alpha-2-macroglobulin family)
MNSRSFLPILAVAVIACLIQTSCKQVIDPLPEINPAFSSYVNAFTSGVIGTEATIKLHLTDAFMENPNLDAPISAKMLSFSPKIDGELWWVDKQTLEFRPKKALPFNQVFEGTFKLNEITSVPETLGDFVFQFRTLKQHAEFQVLSINQYNEREFQWQFLKGYIRTLDVSDNEAVEKVLSATLEGDDLPVTWTHAVDRKLHYFTVDSIQRGEETRMLTLEWDCKKIQSEQKGSTEQEIPALGDFRVIRTEVIQQPEQYVALTFSDPLKAKQNLDGIVKIAGLENVSVIIDKNVVQIHPPYRLTGTQTIDISTGIRNILGYKMLDPITVSVVFEEIKPSVEMAGNRNILPSTEGLVFPFRAVSLSAVDVKVIKVFETNIPQFLQVNSLGGDREMRRVGRVVKKCTVQLNPDGDKNLNQWNTFFLDLEDLISVDRGSIYRIELDFRKKHSLYTCADSDEEEDEQDDDESWDTFDEETSYWDYYDDYYYNYYWNYEYRERHNPCDHSYFVYQRPKARNIIASDLGIIAKQGNDHSMLVTVSDLKTTEVLKNVTVELYTFQNQLISSGKTGEDGILRLPNVDKKPYLLVAKSNEQRGYCQLGDGTSLSLSKFDVAGSTVDRGIKGFLYGERGVWRPGDSLYLNFILEDEKGLLPATHPVVFKLTDPKGKLTEKIVRSKGQNGFFSFATQTSTEAPTGNWQAQVRVGGAVFHKTLKIETIKPNRLKINFDFGKDRIGVADDVVEGAMQVNWLHGAPARNLKARVGATFKSTRTTFSKFRDYKFDDPVRRFHSEEQIIYDRRVDKDGVGNIELDVSLSSKAPGMLKAHFNTKVFEEGGEFSVDRFSIPYAPYETFTGVKLPKGDKSRGMLLTDTEHEVDLVTVDVDGEPVARKDLEVKIYKVHWRWWWVRNEDDLSQYTGSNSVIPIVEGSASTNEQGFGKFKFQIDFPEWGRYLIRVVDKESGHATGQIFYCDWPGWAGRAQRENPGGDAMLVFSSDKKSYKVGEKCKVTFPTDGMGRALLSIESGSGVVDAHWIEAENESTSFEFEVTPEMAPNVFLNITLVQPHMQTANDRPIRLYGVMPISVEDPETHLKPLIAMADELRPEESFSIEVSEKEGKEMTYTLAVVDDGLLDLTRFKTPDPWSHFFAREALGVKTWDIYDQVIGAHGVDLQKLLSLGGDGENEDEDGKKEANRFKPVVIFEGPFTLKPGQKKTHKLDMPNYVGSVRTMVIAGNGSAYGNAQKTTPVRKPVMVLATLPRVLGTGEMVKLPANVFAMKENVKDVEVKLEVNDLLEIQGKSTKTIHFSKIGDQIVEFDLLVADRPGIGHAKVTVRSGDEVAYHEIEIECRNPNPEVTNVVEGFAESKATWSSEFDLAGLEGTNEVLVEISSIPPVDFTKRMRYLIGYPHGCVEQTTSRAFPQLYLSDVVKMDPKLEVEVSGYIKAAVNKLIGFQNTDGGLSYWPGGHVSDWGTTYAGHFMLEAENQGYHVPSSFKTNWINYQRNMSRNWRYVHNNGRSSSSHAQAYRLYTLALAGAAELGAMNRLRETEKLDTQSKWRLAGAYQLAGQPEVAKKIISGLTTDIEDYTELGNSYGSYSRDRAMIIETLTIMGEKSKAAPIVRDLAGELSQEKWHSTQTTAYSLMAIAKFAKSDKTESLRYNMIVNGTPYPEMISNKSVVIQTLEGLDLKDNTISIENPMGGVLFARLLLTGKPATGADKDSNNDLVMNLDYLDMKGHPINVSSIEQGTDFMARVTIKHPGIRWNYDEMALTQIFPSGWEILNTRMDEVGSVHEVNIPEYQDIRDDRVHTYFDLHTNQKQTFTVLLNASYQGRFYLPSTVCEAMYDATVNARKAGKWVEVVKPGFITADSSK